MKKLIIPLFAVLLTCSCSTAKKTASFHANAGIKSDSTEYEITIIDTEFETWYLMNFAESKDYSNEYYRSRNAIGVSNWNNYYSQGKYHRVIENHIFYNFSLDYGIAVNRKLYWYFKYTEQKFRIRLLGT